MNRRGFFATLAAPILARFLPKPAAYKHVLYPTPNYDAFAERWWAKYHELYDLPEEFVGDVILQGSREPAEPVIGYKWTRMEYPSFGGAKPPAGEA